MENFQSLLSESSLVGMYTKPQPIGKTTGTKEGLELCEFLSTIPFWCGDDKLHKKDPDYIHTAKCCMTHIVGLPRHSATNEEMPLTPYQIDMANRVITGREKFGSPLDQARHSLKMHIKKGRQMGFTEIVLRLIQYLCFTRYKGRKIAIIAATNGSLARKDLRRFARLFKNISPVIQTWITRGNVSTENGIIKKNTIELINDVTIEAFSAAVEAITGDTNYKCIFMDEAAKWNLVEDYPVFDSIMPIVRSNGADLFLVSTPKGSVKTFYKIDMDHNENEFEFFIYDITKTIGNLYTQDQVDEMLLAETEDPEQEYLCKYKSGRDSVFKTVTDDDQQGKDEWIIPDEDDGFDETGLDMESIHAV